MLPYSSEDARFKQAVVKKFHDSKLIVHWMLLLDNKVGLELLLELNVDKRENITRISIESVTEGDLNVNIEPFENFDEVMRLELKNGEISLVPEVYGQTILTIRALISFGELNSSISSSFTSGANSRLTSFKTKRLTSLKTKRLAQAFKSGRLKSFKASTVMSSKSDGFVAAGNVLGVIAKVFYERFKKEEVIDRMMLDGFAREIESAPPQTREERALFDRMMQLHMEMNPEMKRIPGTVKDSVEMCILFKKGDAAAWGKTTAKVDLSAISLFSELWMLKTYRLRKVHKEMYGNLPRAVWENLDGSRGLQYTSSVKFPAGLSHRFFDCWITWDVRTREDGQKEYVIVIVPMHEYGGKRRKLKGTEKMMEGWSKGVHIVREVRLYLSQSDEPVVSTD